MEPQYIQSRPGTASSVFTTASIPFSYASSFGIFDPESQPESILHGLFKIKGKTCEVYFDGQNIYWKNVTSDLDIEHKNITTYSNSTENSENLPISLFMSTSYQHQHR